MADRRRHHDQYREQLARVVYMLDGLHPPFSHDEQCIPCFALAAIRPDVLDEVRADPRARAGGEVR